MENKIPNNFIDLIKKFNIRIPIIQRDYVQGRINENVIRENLINNIFEVLTDESGKSKLSLDFIYGKIIDENEEKIFEPIDGQQRLTTLFLLTYFIGKKENVEELGSYKNFSYAIRNSSEEFCEEFRNNFEIIENDKKNNKNLDNDKKFKEYISIQKWFDEKWLKDNTITSMIQMLSLIQKKYTESNMNNLYKNIKNIEFKFIDTKDRNLDDNTYIKLNARGIKLSQFEEYKTSFLEIFYQRSYELYKKLSFDLDIKWTNWIWHNIEYKEYQNNNNLFDQAFLSIFRTILTNQYAFENPITKSDSEKKELLMNFFNMKIAIPFDIYKKALKNMENTIVQIENFFNFIIDNNIIDDEDLNAYIDFKEIILKLINSHKYNNDKLELKNNEKLYFYAVYIYAINNYNNYNRENYLQWTRISRNLIPLPVNDISEFTKILVQLENIFNKIKDKDDLLKEFSNFEIPKDGNYINYIEEHVKNEIIKSKIMLIKSNNKWKQLIEKVDLNKSLNGETEFLLDFCGIEEELKNNNLLNENKCFSLYKKYVELFNVIFKNEKDSEIINNELEQKNILARALLTFKNPDIQNNEFDEGYMIIRGSTHYSFLANNQDRDYSWKNLFSSPKRKYFKNIMDILVKNNAYDIEQIKYMLNEIIKNSDIVDWRKYFIEDNDAFSLLDSSVNLLKIYNNKDIFLKKKEASNSHSLPLIFYIFNKNKPKNMTFKINDNENIKNLDCWSRGTYYKHDMLINEINGKKVIIKIDNTNQTGEFFYYKNLDNLDNEKEDVERILNEIQNQLNVKFEYKPFNIDNKKGENI